MRKFKFTGTGGEIFVKFLVGMILTAITMGIYMPWFMVSIMQYAASKTTIEGGPKGSLQVEFKGTGGQLFVVGLVGALLTSITFGIYGAWFMANLMRFYADNTTAKAADGTTYRLRFTATGGELFVAYLVGILLTSITFGIYAPWFMCKLYTLFAEKTDILRGDTKVGTVAFSGTGGNLFVTFLVGYLLTMVTLGIYSFWFQVKMMQFMAQNTKLTVDNQALTGDFVGTGGQLFVLSLVGGLLTSITFGIYGAWFFANLTRYQLENMQFGGARG
ncbi:MAG: DUF898 family protein [Pseudomonadota bacterium]